MEWNDAIDLSKLKFTSRLIVQRALERGWQVCGFKSNLAIFLLHIPGRDTPVQIFSASPPQMSYPASKIAKDKYITNQILAHSGLPVPKELLVNAKELSDKVLLQEFLEDCGTVVVKPLDASHGKGITMGVTSAAQLETALAIACKESARSRVLVQQQIEGMDVRVVCIDYQFVDAISRQPASVVGDGTSTVAQLINTTNTSPERGENYQAKLNYIPLAKAQAYLGDEKMARVPEAGEAAQVIGVSNIGMGGARQNIRDVIPELLRDMAIEAAKTLELPVCGVDFMVTALPVANSNLEDLQPHIIEVNECPMLTMYEQLDCAEQYAVIDRYLDFVAKAP